MINTETGEEKIFNFNLFNSETDHFPYEEATFDVVLFCEILEHLILDPIRAISEINRVLKQGGYLILTTPLHKSDTLQLKSPFLHNKLVRGNLHFI